LRSDLLLQYYIMILSVSTSFTLEPLPPFPP
jgi:hypothetical protein